MQKENLPCKVFLYGITDFHAAPSDFLRLHGKESMSDTGESHKTAKSEQTRKHIQDTYILLIREKKWDRISVIEICKKASITRGTFYQYYSDIYDLMEQLEQKLLDELARQYHASHKINEKPPSALRGSEFKISYTPPQNFSIWFDFCRKNSSAMISLLDRHNGDTYFVKKLNVLISDAMNSMMDDDHIPRDDLRAYFVKTITELHFLSAQYWLTSDRNDDDFLSIPEIVNLLNTMRVGALYLSEMKLTDPSFEEKMNL